MAELFVLVLTISAILVVSLFFNAPLEQPVNVMHPPNPAKAPWYFLGLQEMVSYSAFWGGMGVPGVMVVLLLMVPYIDRNTAGVGRWFARERLLANTLFVTLVILNVIFIVIGTFFRGPNWAFVSPSETTRAYATGSGNCKLRGSDRARRGVLRSVLPP